MHSAAAIKRLLKDLHKRRLSVKAAFKKLRTLPYQDLGFAKIDTHRYLRRGFPEVIYAQGKTREQISKLVSKTLSYRTPLIITRADQKLYNYLKKGYRSLKFSKDARIIYANRLKKTKSKNVLIITAGTSDITVAEEAALTLEIMGNNVMLLYDVGTAGVHRLLDNKRKIEEANVIIVVAGMEGALASVVSGLVDKPVIAVPTSVGYGASFKGLAALLTMLNSCSPGIGVVNIDNGFGAGYLAHLIIRKVA